MIEGQPKISRRVLLKSLIVSATAAVVGPLLEGCGGVEGSAEGPTTEAKLKPTETSTPTPTSTPRPEPTPTTPTQQSTPMPEAEMNPVLEGSSFTPAEKQGNKWTLHTSDNEPVKVSLPEEYTPDATLKISDIRAKNLLPVPEIAGNFQEYLNNPDDEMGALAGFTDSVNDYNEYYNHRSGPQLPAYSWEVFTGLDVEIPGVGRVEGGPGRAAMVLIINRTDDVYRWPTNSVRVEAGFKGWGRIWNGEAKYVQETEKRLVQHFLTRLGQGVPETGFIGQCDQGARNCDEVAVVSVERIQWGNNPDGSPRYQFRLIRAETIPAAK